MRPLENPELIPLICSVLYVFLIWNLLLGLSLAVFTSVIDLLLLSSCSIYMYILIGCSDDMYIQNIDDQQSTQKARCYLEYSSEFTTK